MKQAVFCIANSGDQANFILARLAAGMFADNDISVIYAEKSGSAEIPEDGGTLVDPDVLVAVGPLVEPLTGVLGAAAGIVGIMVDMGVPQMEAEDYETKVHAGNI